MAYNVVHQLKEKLTNIDTEPYGCISAGPVYFNYYR